MQKEEITFKPFIPYSQKQNRMSEQMERTILDITRATNLKEKIDNELWPELVLAIIYVKNNRSTRALQNVSPYEIHS